MAKNEGTGSTAGCGPSRFTREPQPFCSAARLLQNAKLVSRTGGSHHVISSRKPCWELSEGILLEAFGLARPVYIGQSAWPRSIYLL